MKITFLGEHRTVFQEGYSEGDVSVMGSYSVREALLTYAWQKPTVAKVTFSAPTAWVQNNLLPGNNPGILTPPHRRARYFTIRKESGQMTTLLIEELEYSYTSEEESVVTITGIDARIWTQRMMSAINSPTETWTSSRTSLAEMLTDRVSDSDIVNKMPWQRLPMSRLSRGWWPTEDQRRRGFVNPSQVDDGTQISITSPDPLPIADSLKELHSQWKDTELYPLETPGVDGTASPWWTWVLRQRVHSDFLFSEKNGTLKINKIKASNAVSETLAYNSQNQNEFSFANGKTMELSNPALRGPWIGLKAESHSTPEGISTPTYLKSRAMTGNYNNRRLSFDATVNFSEAGVEPSPGMTVFMRIDDSIVRVPLGEVASHYSAEKGWSTTSAVFIETESIDLYDPTPPPVDLEEDIQFVIQGDSFRIPTNHADPFPYDWTVLVDGQDVGNFSGTSSETSSGIQLSALGQGEHLITLKPTGGEYRDGWAAAFNFWSNSDGANAASNKAKLLRVLSDREAGHLNGNVLTSYGFRQNQFYGCVSLTVGPVEEPMNYLFGGYFGGSRESQYEGCTSLRKAQDEAPSYTNDRARLRQYADCINLVEPAAEAEFNIIEWQEGIADLGSRVREEQYIGCRSLVRAAAEVLSEETKQVGEGYRRRQYAYCINLRSAGPEAMPMHVDEIRNDFRLEQYMHCYSLEASPDEVMPSEIKTYPRGYRDRQYAYCSALREAGKEAAAEVQDGGAHWGRDGQYMYCANLIEPADEVSPMNAVMDQARDRQYMSCASLVRAAAENPSMNSTYGPLRIQQYSDCYSLTEAASEVMPSGITHINDDYRKEQYRRCISLVKAGKEAFSSDVQFIGDRFRYYQYADCGAMVEAFDEVFSDSVTRVGADFRNSQFYNCAVLANTPAEAFSAGLTEIPNFFRIYQYNQCWGLQDPAVELLSENIVKIGNGYRSHQYSHSSVKNADGLLIEHEMPNVTSVGDYFRYNQFQNSEMVRGLKERWSTVLCRFGRDCRTSQYAGSIFLIEGSVEPDMTVSTVTEAVEGGGTRTFFEDGYQYRAGQYTGCQRLNHNTQLILETATRETDEIKHRVPDSWRIGQYKGTANYDIPAYRVHFKDGIAARFVQLDSEYDDDKLYASNVPANFYGPQPEFGTEPDDEIEEGV